MHVKCRQDYYRRESELTEKLKPVQFLKKASDVALPPLPEVLNLCGEGGGIRTRVS
jgi:hypothetical protein